MVGMHPRRADVLGGSTHAQVARVDVHRCRFGNVAWNDCTLVEVQMLHAVDEARNVVCILRGRLAVITGLWIGDVHGRTGGAEVGVGTPRLHVVLRVLGVQREVATGHRDRVFDERTREQQTPIRVQLASLRKQVVERGLDRIGKTDVLENVERRFVDLQHFGIGEHLVATARHSGANWLDVVRQRCGAQRVASGATSTTCVLLF